MSHAGVELISTFLAESGMTTGTVAERRSALDQMAQGAPPPEGVGVETVVLGGRRGRAAHPGGCASGSVVLYLHGGGYCSGSLDSHRQLASRIALASKLPVALLDYRLAPEDPFPAAVDDATAAYRDLVSSRDRPPTIWPSPATRPGEA